MLKVLMGIGGLILAFVGVMNWTFYGLGYPGTYLPLGIGIALFLVGGYTPYAQSAEKKIIDEKMREHMNKDKDWKDHIRRQK